MNNNIQQQMQNWKKQIIMDPVLNHLFDSTLPPQQFLHTHILTLDQQQIVNTYSKLASLKHSISKNIQKEVQTKHNQIEQSFKSLHQLQLAFPKSDRKNLQSSQKYLQKFNHKYENIHKSLSQWKNTTKLLHFAKALECFHINIRMLKTQMKGYKQQQQINAVKISKLIKQLTEISIAYQFDGMEVFQNEKVFVKNAKSIAYAQTQKKLLNIIQKGKQSQHQIKQKLHILDNLNKISQFVSVYYKISLKEIGDILKKTFNSQNLQEFQLFCSNMLRSKIICISNSLIYLQELLISSQMSGILLSNGIPNLFEKMWDKFIQYCKEILKWSSEQELKQKKNNQRLLVYKYPILFHQFAFITNEIHSEIITNTTFYFYQFSYKKQQLLLTLEQLARNYYRNFDEQCKLMVNQLSKAENDKINDKIVNFVTYVQWITARIQISQILSQVLSITQNRVSILQQNQIHKTEIINLYKKLKNIFLTNNYLQIHNASQIRQFLINHSPDKQQQNQ